MAQATTTYDVITRYKLDDRASRKMDVMSRRFSKLSRNLRLASAGYLLGSGVRSLMKHTVGFNRELGKARNSMATVIQMFNEGASRGSAMEMSSKFIERMRKDAKETAGTMMEMVDFAKQISAPLMEAGITMEGLAQFTKKSMVAAAATGVRQDVAANDIRQAIQRGVTVRDPLANMLLNSIKMSRKEFGKLSKQMRAKTLFRALDSKAIKDAEKAYKKSFEGNYSTMISNLQEFGGKVGEKLFAKLTKLFIKFNKWFDKNKNAVNSMADRMGNALLTAFNTVQKVVGFIVEHKELFTLLAKAALVAKTVGVVSDVTMLGAGALNFVRTGMGGMAGRTGSSIVGSAFGAGANAKGVEAMGVAVTSLVGSAAAGYALGTMFDDLYDISGRLVGTFDALDTAAIQDKLRKQGKIKNVNGLTPEGYFNASAHNTTMTMPLIIAKQKKIMLDLKSRLEEYGKFGHTYRGKFYSAKGTPAYMEKEKALASATSLLHSMEGILSMANKRLNIRYSSEWTKSIEEKWAREHSALFKDVKDKTDPKNNVNIGKLVIQVDSDDPDRLALGLEDLFSDLLKNGAQATGALYEGR